MTLRTLVMRVLPVKTPEGKVVQVEVPWPRPGSGFTLLFEAYLVLSAEFPRLCNSGWAGLIIGLGLRELAHNRAASHLDVTHDRLVLHI